MPRPQLAIPGRLTGRRDIPGPNPVEARPAGIRNSHMVSALPKK
jgi:hypothetical protein